MNESLMLKEIAAGYATNGHKIIIACIDRNTLKTLFADWEWLNLGLRVSEQPSARLLKGAGNMTKERIVEKLEKYKQALARLEEALTKKEPDQFVYDAAIKRFEFTYELAWKLMKALIEYKGGEDVHFPRDVFKEAYAKGLLENGEIWLDMLNDRNLSSHTYNRERAMEIFKRVKDRYFDEFVRLTGTIEGEMKK
ncbi:nucleotidyltransferase substrate binding protein [Thermincola ferriacetica]